MLNGESVGSCTRYIRDVYIDGQEYELVVTTNTIKKRDEGVWYDDEK